MAGDAAAPDLKTYHGNCHCGAFRYYVKFARLDEVTYCNCSFCSKVRLLLLCLWVCIRLFLIFLITEGDLVGLACVHR